jgi:hypothetical protein
MWVYKLKYLFIIVGEWEIQAESAIKDLSYLWYVL